ncbi:CLUMA_CG011050, isoform C [Clunio marinus]|uniref:CLUMA_CG011050, isoform C n=1 Tax=Clunio marinus TaxID=568069 RepID=A0A1J1IBT7_9DIPT|nr:CLUMA_CG011050, isoform C [Clunio marinus]
MSKTNCTKRIIGSLLQLTYLNGIEDQTTSIPIDKILLDRTRDRINWAQEIIFMHLASRFQQHKIHSKLLKGVANIYKLHFHSIEMKDICIKSLIVAWMQANEI